MNVLIIKTDLKWCKWLGKKRSASMGHAETKNSKNMVGGTPWKRHYFGAIGEKAWSILTGEPVDVKTIGRGDAGTDFSNGTQVKGAYQRKKPNLLIPVDQYDRKIAKRYILGWIKQKDFGVVVEILGQISRGKCDRVKRFVKKGDMNMKVDTWLISNTHLEVLNLVGDLKRMMKGE